MAKKRNEIAMTDEEMDAYLREGHTLQVATIGEDGYPHMVAMWYAVVDGKVAFATYKKSQKVTNLHRDSRITVMLESGEEYNKLKGLTIQGKAEIIDGNPELAAKIAMTSTSRKPGDFEKMAAVEPPEQVLKAVAKRSVIIVHPEKIFSWDHNKLGGAY